MLTNMCVHLVAQTDDELGDEELLIHSRVQSDQMMHDCFERHVVAGNNAQFVEVM